MLGLAACLKPAIEAMRILQKSLLKSDVYHPEYTLPDVFSESPHLWYKMYLSILLLSGYLLVIFSQTQAQPLRHNHYLYQRHKHSHHHHQPEVPFKRTLGSVLGGSAAEQSTPRTLSQHEDHNTENNGALQVAMA